LTSSGFSMRFAEFKHFYLLQEGFELDTAPSSAQLNRQRRRETATKEKESQICQLFKAKPFLAFF
jgi:hypothetical protein